MLAIIGGTGVYELDGLDGLDRLELGTPFGLPSGPVWRGVVGGHDVLFLARHGAGHRQLPHEINYRANIFALKLAGATQIVGISAVGSLRERIEPGQLVVPFQYFDWTRGRNGSFFGDGVVAHVSTAEPVSAHLARWIGGHAQRLGMPLHQEVTYGCIQGPRLGTRSESHFLRMAGCDVVGMTNVPEAFLAREAQICYATIGVATDYDCWLDDPSMHVTVDAIFSLYAQSLAHVRTLLTSMLNDARPPEEPEIRAALGASMMSRDCDHSAEQARWLDVLRR